MYKETGIQKLSAYAFKSVSNAALVYLRILFGFIMFADAVFALQSGQVKEIYTETKFNFTFIGFEWLGFLHGDGMYAYYMVMGLMGLLVCLGLFYRFTSITLAVMWTAVYLLQKTHYNNHYYLMMLFCWLMVMVPAHKRFSADVRRGAVTGSNTCPQWCLYIFRFQVACVFIFASIAKIYPDWLHALPLKVWLSQKTAIPVLGHLFQTEWMPYLIAYAGILFDLLLIPALLWKRTRNIAFIAALIFNWFNATVFNIGTFPFMALGLAAIFYPAATFEQFIPDATNQDEQTYTERYKYIVTLFAALYVSTQIILPFRHHVIPGNVVWTEEGHRLSWRMMLRAKYGTAVFTIKDKHTGKYEEESNTKHLHPEQIRAISCSPDMCWQYARYLKNYYNHQGRDVSVYVKSMVSLNGRQPQLLIDTTVDLAAQHWRYFAHNQWIMPHPEL